ncbi:Transcription factor Myb domain-containing protein [Dioscorea alata]|uniref:Transcription factor Myb domain-containing protein n=1 Tax=Dioscorea alata TaxID=55571 RepID=A0ACB7V7P2_DIOAL|nr:Transcription factor Myb domain-containing protein [Dioscorea alata]
MVKKEEMEDWKREKVQDVQLAVQMKSNSAHRRTIGRTRRSSKGGWTEEEDEELIRAVKKFNGKNWKKIAECIPGRTDVQCLHRYDKVLNPNLIKGSWTKEEDDLIRGLIAIHGTKNWSVIASCVPGRIGKQCRERWHNHLNPTIRKDAWTKEEELILICAHKEYGNKWAEIAKRLPGRADNSIKNHWNCSVQKRLSSILASVAPSQPIGLVALNPNNYSPKPGILPTNPTEQDIKDIAPLEQKSTQDKLLCASNECSVDTRLALQSSICQPAFSRRSSDAVVQTISLETSNLRTLDHNYRTNLSEFLKPLRLEDKSPASVLNNSLFRDSPQCSTGLSNQGTKPWFTKDSDHIDASDNSQDAKVLQQRDYIDFGNQFNKMQDTTHEHHALDFNRSEFSISGVKLKDKIVANSSATDSCDCDQISRTPLCCSKVCSPINNSTPSSDLSPWLGCTPSSTEYFLKIAGRNYEHTPSIIRRRGLDSSKRLFPESPKKAVGETQKSDSTHDSDENDASIKNVDSDTKHANKKKFLFDLNIPHVSDEMEWDGSTT